jgi:hypothetical protein
LWWAASQKNVWFDFLAVFLAAAVAGVACAMVFCHYVCCCLIWLMLLLLLLSLFLLLLFRFFLSFLVLILVLVLVLVWC